jgi:DNA-binding LytR/AlgR family response regulator
VRVLIVDDEAAARARLARMLEELDVECAGEAESGVRALEQVRALRPTLLLLDIAMPEVDGFDVARHLPEPRPLIVFQTAHDEHALRAFEHEAVDYIVKPVTLERLAAALERARRRLQRADDSTLSSELLQRLQAELGAAARRPRILVRHGSGHRLVALRDVARFCAEQGLVEVHASGERHGCDYTLVELEARTAGEFVRASRSELVNLAHVERIASNGDGSARLTLRDGSTVRVSRRRATTVRLALDR